MLVAHPPYTCVPDPTTAVKFGPPVNDRASFTGSTTMLVVAIPLLNELVPSDAVVSARPPSTPEEPSHPLYATVPRRTRGSSSPEFLFAAGTNRIRFPGAALSS